ncbi:MAG: Mrp/NBP35 family ATP-binding protein [Rhodobacteraceae bacterium]|nr:Mrp/NBP35 family ATP-binding protein [Paracoccaceae bacterium]
MTQRDTVLTALKTVKTPAGNDIVSAGLVKALTVDNGAVRFVLEVPAAQAEALQLTLPEAKTVVQALDGIKSVSAVMTAHNSPAAPPDLKTGHKSEPKGPQKIPGIKKIIAIASGKGGVGKSTLSANLAVALAVEGKRVGLLDADVFGPSQPRMLGVTGRPASPDGKTILPLRNHGVTLMSIGLMTNENEAVVWRGPMLIGALQQMLTQVQWGALDVLIVDLPPGTGDVQMTLAQKTALDGAIIVSTPQDVALIDTRKGIDMFNKLGTPILGMVENMSYQICEECGHKGHPFGHGGVAEEAAKIGVPLLAELPLHLDIRVASDAGAPIVVSKPESPQAQAFRVLARRLIEDGTL